MTKFAVSWRRAAALVSFLVPTALVSGCAQNTPGTSNAGTLNPSLPAIKDEVAPVRTALDDYIARPEPKFAWKVESQTGNITNLQVTSQEWQGRTWTHRVEVIRPDKVTEPNLALVMISYGSGNAQESLFGGLAANAMGATFINIWNVPNQPLWDRREDDLISYTFQKYFETGDDTWPLLLPMTKSVTKSLDAVQQWAQQENLPELSKFVVSGASKRGWTSWLVAAVDKRVAGIVPMVYDNLNLQKQMPHQMASWGAYSSQIEDYTKRGLQQMLGTPQGQKLVQIVDPWTYRERYTMPKLIINGTNDRYWPLDAYNLYRNDLPAPTNVIYAPNAGHSLGGAEQRTAGAAVAWVKALTRGAQFPQVDLRAVSETANTDQSTLKPLTGNQFTMSVSNPDPQIKVRALRLWVAHSATRDFRDAKWEDTPLELNEKTDLSKIAVPVPATPGAAKYSAAFAEAEFTAQPLPMFLASPVIIWPAK
jgi:PhoPQ-activated pathogenicity-related protein